MSTNLGLVVHTTEAESDELATKRPRHRSTQAGLAHSGRTNQTENWPFWFLFQLADGQRLQRVAAQPLGHRAELVGQGHRLVRGQVEEHEPAPGRHPDRVEPEGCLVEAVDLLAPGGAQQVALEPVGPGVVGAAQGPGPAGRGGLGTAWRAGRARHHLGGPRDRHVAPVGA